MYLTEQYRSGGPLKKAVMLVCGGATLAMLAYLANKHMWIEVTDDDDEENEGCSSDAQSCAHHYQQEQQPKPKPKFVEVPNLGLTIESEQFINDWQLAFVHSSYPLQIAQYQCVNDVSHPQLNFIVEDLIHNEELCTGKMDAAAYIEHSRAELPIDTAENVSMKSEEECYFEFTQPVEHGGRVFQRRVANHVLAIDGIVVVVQLLCRDDEWSWNVHEGMFSEICSLARKWRLSPSCLINRRKSEDYLCLRCPTRRPGTDGFSCLIPIQRYELVSHAEDAFLRLHRMWMHKQVVFCARQPQGLSPEVEHLSILQFTSKTAYQYVTKKLLGVGKAISCDGELLSSSAVRRRAEENTLQQSVDAYYSRQNDETATTTTAHTNTHRNHHLRQARHGQRHHHQQHQPSHHHNPLGENYVLLLPRDTDDADSTSHVCVAGCADVLVLVLVAGKNLKKIAANTWNLLQSIGPSNQAGPMRMELDYFHAPSGFRYRLPFNASVLAAAAPKHHSQHHHQQASSSRGVSPQQQSRTTAETNGHTTPSTCTTPTTAALGENTPSATTTNDYEASQQSLEPLGNEDDVLSADDEEELLSATVVHQQHDEDQQQQQQQTLHPPPSSSHHSGGSHQQQGLALPRFFSHYFGHHSFEYQPYGAEEELSVNIGATRCARHADDLLLHSAPMSSSNSQMPSTRSSTAKNTPGDATTMGGATAECDTEKHDDLHGHRTAATLDSRIAELYPTSRQVNIHHTHEGWITSEVLLEDGGVGSDPNIHHSVKTVALEHHGHLVHVCWNVLNAGEPTTGLLLGGSGSDLHIAHTGATFSSLDSVRHSVMLL